MATPTTQEPSYHALLIGVDSYTVKPLFGCVNDIDAVQRVLLDRAGIPAARITRLASPHPGAKHETDVPTEPATLANIRTAFAELGSESVRPSDRVFIYYAGHGGRQPIRAGTQKLHRESLLPVDFNAGPSRWDVLFDFELNQLLAAVTARTRSVTFILDCCHSTGATRDLQKPGMTARFIDFEQDLGLREPVTIPGELEDQLGTAARGIIGNTAESVNDCQVVAACLNHELASEDNTPDGVRHGLLTCAFINALGGVAPEEVRTVPWGRVWNGMRAAVEAQNSAQHLWISGGLARAVLAGPPADGDVGLGIVRTGANEYRIDAGSLAGVTVGARLAVYGERPFKFPRLGSGEDLSARSGGALLEVTEATRATAMARADGEPFDLPPGARGRLVEAGAPERLRCAVVPEDSALVAALAESPLLQVTGERDALARLERQPDGTRVLTDDVHGARDGYPVLFRIESPQPQVARAVMEHYVRYAAPIRMAKLCTDLPGALQVALLECPRQGTIPAAQAEAADLREYPVHPGIPYELVHGDTFCVRVHNTSSERLRVFLLNCAASGRVQALGDQIIDDGRIQLFWFKSELGRPFKAGVPEGATQGIDRLVAIGTTAVDNALGHLTEKKRFAEVAEEAAARRSPRDIDDEEDDGESQPVDHWTATETMFRTRNQP